MIRKGTIILLGAGASASAGYPTAAGLLERFRTLLHKESEEERDAVKRSREQMAQLMQASGSAPQLQNASTLEEWFIPIWQQFKKASAAVRPLAVPSLSQDGRPQRASAVFQGPGGGVSFAPYTLPLEGPLPMEISEPYLEDFFAFYDEILRPRVRSILTEFSFSADAPHRFRQLRQIAIKAAYQALTIRGRDVASYLEPLFNLDGPTGRSAPIVTLNFDMSVEQLASIRDIPLFDGFGQETDEPPMLGWDDDGLHSLSALWRAVSENLIPFVGFQNAPSNATLLLKLHGSLGWFVLEEGNGDIGTRE